MVLHVHKQFRTHALVALLLSGSGLNAGLVTAQATDPSPVSPAAPPATAPQQPASTNSPPAAPATTTTPAPAPPQQPASSAPTTTAPPGPSTSDAGQTPNPAPGTTTPTTPAAPGQSQTNSTAPATPTSPGTEQPAAPAAPGQPQPDSSTPSVPSPSQAPVLPSFTAGQRTPRITIPKASAITVTFCSTVRFDSKHKSTFPVVAYLARPVMDHNGNILAPVNSLVNAQLKPTKEGVQVSVDALVVGGRFIPIRTAQLSVPMLAKTDQQNNYYSYSYNDDNLGIAFNVANGLQEWLADQDLLSNSFSDVLGAGLTVAAGVSRGRSRPKITEVMEVPQGSTLVFPLLVSVSLPSMPLQALAAPAQPPAVCSNSPGGGGSYSNYGSNYNYGGNYNNGSYNQDD